jgi:hypothetical protein
MTTEELERRIRAEGVAITPAGLLRERAAAQVLGVSSRTLREWRLERKPPAWRKLNGGVWYSVGALCEYLNSGE